MKATIVLSLIVAGAVSVCLYSVKESHRGQSVKKPMLTFKEAIEDEIDKRKGPDGNIDTMAIRRAMEHREQMPKAYLGYQASGTAPQAPWVHIGPFGVRGPFSYCYGTSTLSGRKESIAVAKGDGNTIWTMSRGGAYKSTDGGVSWANMSHGWKFANANCVAIDPVDKNIVYVGTGDFADGMALGALPFGIMKTTDGGQSWTNHGDLDTFANDEVITEVLIAPWNRNTVFCTTRVGTRVSAGVGNLYRSIDAGQTWSTVGVTSRPYTDLAASLPFLNGSLRVSYYVYASDSNGTLWRTTNGTTWTQTSANAGGGYTHIATGKLSATTIYAVSSMGIRRSTTRGDSWTDFNTAGFPATKDGGTNWAQLTYNLFVGVTKMDSDTEKIYVGNLSSATRTTDSTTWTDLSRSYNTLTRAHADHHSFANDPNDDNRVYIGTDGGLYRNLANSTSMTGLNSPIGDFQLYAMDVHPTQPDFVLVGAQDNATLGSRGNLNAWTGLDSWDGGFTVFDRINPKVHYTTSQRGFVYKYTGDFQNSDVNLDLFATDSQRAGSAFIAPLATVGSGSEILLGTGRILRYSGTGTTWTSGYQTPSTVDEIATIGNTVFFGTRAGGIYRSPDKGSTATEVGVGVPNEAIGAIHMKSTTDVIVGLMGTSGGLWRSTNAGVAAPTWTDVGGTGRGSLPSTPVMSIAVDPHNQNRWYVGTDMGIFMTSNAGLSWANCNTQGFPNVGVTSLKALHGYLYAATTGRGVWRIKVGSTVGRSISGHVTESGVGVKDVRMRLTRTMDIEKRLSNSVAQQIPDNDPDGIGSDIFNFANNNTMVSCKIFVHITHPYRGDLQIDILGPNGVTRRLKDGGVTDSGDDVVATFDVTSTFGGVSALGAWELQVRDLEASDVGTLNTWSVIYTYQGSATIAERMTSSSGFYEFSDMLADGYVVQPFLSPKVFVPFARSVTLNGVDNATEVDFQSLVPASLTVQPIDVIGGDSVAGALTMNLDPQFTAQVNVTSNSGAVTPPSPVAMTTVGPTGFSIPTTKVANPVTATLTATYGGVSKTAQLKVHPVPTLQGITAGPTPVYGGTKISGTVMLTAAAPASTRVYLSGFAPDLVPNVPYVTIAKGLTAASFTASTAPVTAPVVRKLWAMLDTQSKSVSIQIEPPPVISSWSFTPSSVVGGNPTVGTVTLARPAANGGVRIYLSDNSASLSMPATIQIPAGSTSKTVTATTSSVTATTTVNCKAQFYGGVGPVITKVIIQP